MVDILLTAEPFLGGYYQEFDGITLEELTDISLMSIAQPLRGRTALQKAVRAVWGCTLPRPGVVALSKNNKVRLLCLTPDSYLGVFTNEISAKEAATDLGQAAYCTDQSDNWVTLRIDGPKARMALARICPINLHAETFPVGAFARTSMEHLGVIVLRGGPDEFMLMSASSSAGSFLHSITTSINNVEHLPR
ncbi:MAG: sarcosine oxidase subunit gamma [Rhodobacteraceae bacterium]|nr:sarcosine oxidase subunit gamma [Paracoccaceae bacterium]